MLRTAGICHSKSQTIICRFDEKENVSGFTQLKSSVQKGLKNKLIDQFPHLENYMSQILPKKEGLRILKW